MSKPLILIVEDDASMSYVLAECLKIEDYDTLQASQGEQAIELFEKTTPDLVLLDLKIPRLNGLEVLKHLKRISPEALIIMLTGHATINTAVESMKEGAYDFISKPFEVDELMHTVKEAMKKRSVIKENQVARTNASSPSEEVYRSTTSPVSKKVDDIISSVAESDYTVLIEGESGTGKSLVAADIHKISYRKDKPFVRVDCAALYSNLVESELFGFEKGSFTGAVSTKIGKLERANGGTLFLDEISTLDLNGQASLLSVIQNQEIERIGSSKPQVLDIRIIAATNQNLKQMVKEKTFRHDLYYRLNVFTVYMPSLRERREDIIPLTYFFIRKYCRRDQMELSPEAAMKLKTYDWPGNIRELENAVKHALILVRDGNIIQSEHLPLELNQGYWAFRDKNLGLREILATTEKNIIEQALLENDLNVEQCARSLKVSRRTLYYRMSKLDVNLFRDESGLR
ncbi:putative two-component response regulator [hydrocarbon metagenome]|uniref:Putative two-component response regulator n=1 Tax=hydrocarbon metagenome TaxID=938273 RepID=A0A0W8E4E0_9ZZZZ